MRVEFKWHFSIRFIKTTDLLSTANEMLRIQKIDAEIARLNIEGMTQKEIAKIVGINQGSVSRRLKALRNKE